MHSRTQKKPTRKGVGIRSKLALAGTMVVLAGMAIATPASASWSTAFSWVQSQLKTSQISDAFKTVVSQDAVGTSQLAEISVMAKQKQISAEDLMLKKSNIAQLYIDYMGPSATMDSSRCVAMNSRLKESKIPEIVKLNVQADLINNLNSGGFKSEEARVHDLQAMKFGLACTLEQTQQGYCTTSMSGAQYFDSDFGMSLSTNRLADSQFLAAKAGVFTIANPSVDATTVKECSGDSSCSAKLGRQTQRIAVDSLVANSLLNQLYNRMSLGSTDENKKL